MYKFKPILKSMLWGGDKIIPYKEVESSKRQAGESWEISGVKENESVVAEGIDAGMKLPELIARDKAALLGKSNYENNGDESDPTDRFFSGFFSESLECNGVVFGFVSLFIIFHCFF